jgi:hypothetical protein
VLHEAGGVNVLLARAVAGRMTGSWSLQGNLLFQKPLTEDRDAVDLITSIGWARKFSRGLSIGIEAIGGDLEGFWKRRRPKAAPGCWRVRACTSRRRDIGGS